MFVVACAYLEFEPSSEKRFTAFPSNTMAASGSVSSCWWWVVVWWVVEVAEAVATTAAKDNDSTTAPYLRLALRLALTALGILPGRDVLLVLGGGCCTRRSERRVGDWRANGAALLAAPGGLGAAACGAIHSVV